MSDTWAVSVKRRGWLSWKWTTFPSYPDKTFWSLPEDYGYALTKRGAARAAAKWARRKAKNDASYTTFKLVPDERGADA